MITLNKIWRYAKYIVLIIVGFLCGNFYGSNSFYIAADCNSDGNISIYYPHWFSTRDALNHERKYCNAWMELCHYYLYDNNPAYCEECNGIMPEADNSYWLDVVSESKFYDKIDSLNQGDWEDFYTSWQ